MLVLLRFTYLIDEKDGVVILLLLYDKADASSIKMNVVRQIIKDLGLDLQQLQSDGKLKAVEIKETEEEIVSSPAVNNQRLAANNDGMTMTK